MKPPAELQADRRVVLTLDAGGTNFRFSALCGGTPVVEAIVFPSCPDILEDCIQRLVEGFRV